MPDAMLDKLVGYLTYAEESTAQVLNVHFGAADTTRRMLLNQQTILVVLRGIITHCNQPESGETNATETESDTTEAETDPAPPETEGPKSDCPGNGPCPFK